MFEPADDCPDLATLARDQLGEGGMLGRAVVHSSIVQVRPANDFRSPIGFR
jgi:hypothetical protein